MKVLIINGSPKSKNSETLKLTKTFVSGMDAKAKEIDTINCDIRPCLGCYKCWKKESRKCCVNDDMHKILRKMKDSDVIIWSTPLFCYSVPSTMKALLDRMTSLLAPEIIELSDGSKSHPAIDAFNAKHVLISGSPLPEADNCFDAIKFQFKHMFGEDIEMILCSENKLFNITGAQTVANEYLKTIEKAGKEFVEFGHILRETHEKLAEPMLPTDIYIESVNSNVTPNSDTDNN